MPFDPTAAIDLTVAPAGDDVRASWSPGAPAGAVYQLYAGGRHVYTGTGTAVTLPRPHEPTWYVAGSVGPGEALADFSASLPAPPGGGRRVTLSWPGGTYLKADLVGFRVYRGPAAGAAVAYGTPVATVAAYSQGSVTDGYGRGGYGRGGYGRSESWYSWVSPTLAAGVWNFGVRPFDAAGNEGAAFESAVTVAGPPGPVPRGAAGARVAYALGRLPGGGYGTGGYGRNGYGRGGDPGPSYVTLSWAASPGA